MFEEINEPAIYISTHVIPMKIYLQDFLEISLEKILKTIRLYKYYGEELTNGLQRVNISLEAFCLLMYRVTLRNTLTYIR